MTIGEARKLLGKNAQKMTDEQVARLIEEVDALAKLALDVARYNRLNEKSDEKPEKIPSSQSKQLH